MDSGRGFATDVEPEPGSNAARLTGLELRLIMRMRFHGLQRLDEGAVADRGAIDGLRAVLHGVEDAQIDGVHLELAGQIVDRALDGEGRHRRAGRTIGRDLGPVADHVIADQREVLDVVAGKRRHAAEIDRRTGERAGLVSQGHFGRGDLAVLRRGQPDIHGGARRRSRGEEDFLAGHNQLHRPPAFARKRQRHGLEINGRLAAKAAADLGGDHFDV